MDSNCSVEKCSCEETESDSSSSDQQKDKRTKIFPSLGLNLRRGRSLHFTSKRMKKTQAVESGFCCSTSGNSTSSGGAGSGTTLNTALRKFIKFNCVRKEPKSFLETPSDAQCSGADYCSCSCSCSKCTNYKRREELARTDPTETYSPNERFPIIIRDETPETVEEQQPEAMALPSPEAAAVEEEPTASSSIPEPPLESRNSWAAESSGGDSNSGIYGTSCLALPVVLTGKFIDVQSIRSIHEDCEEQARMQREREIEQGVEAPANFRPVRRVQLLCSDVETEGGGQSGPRRLQLVCPPDLTVDSLRALFQTHVTVRSCPLDTITGCHTQVDFIHCLVPDLLDITNCSFYWGKMDRYEAERLLDGKPEGTFLLRDSAQEEFLFSVSFRKYGRSLHARIEQWNHKFSFDSHDPNVYTTDTVCGLIEHYKDPTSCMFFEPMLTRPLHRNFTFPLQHLCRATIVNRLTYDSINQLQLPKTLKAYLKEYHYRQKVRVERFDDDVQWLDLTNGGMM